MDNVIYGKTMENVRNRIDVNLVYDEPKPSDLSQNLKMI